MAKARLANMMAEEGEKWENGHFNICLFISKIEQWYQTVEIFFTSCRSNSCFFVSGPTSIEM